MNVVGIALAFRNKDFIRYQYFRQPIQRFVLYPFEAIRPPLAVGSAADESLWLKAELLEYQVPLFIMVGIDCEGLRV